MKEIPYLKEKELEELIRRIEEDELMAAPPDLLENLLLVVEEPEKRLPVSADEETEKKQLISALPVKERRTSISVTETRRKEYNRFCRRVISTAAAAAVVVLVMSGRLYLQGTAVPSKTAVLMRERPVISKESAAEQEQHGVLRMLRNSDKLSEIIFRRDMEDET